MNKTETFVQTEITKKNVFSSVFITEIMEQRALGY